MKKTLLSLSAIAAFSAVTAQAPVSKEATEIKKMHREVSGIDMDLNSALFSVSDIYSNSLVPGNNGPANYGQTLFPDTTALEYYNFTEDPAGFYSTQHMSGVGVAFDWSDENWERADFWPQGYSKLVLDSVAITYSYDRVNGVNDTMVVTVLTGLSRNNFTSDANMTFHMPGSPQTFNPMSPFEQMASVDTFVVDSSFITDEGIVLRSFFDITDLELDSIESFGIYVTYKPGVEIAENDSIGSENVTNPKHNKFSVAYNRFNEGSNITSFCAGWFGDHSNQDPDDSWYQDVNPGKRYGQESLPVIGVFMTDLHTSTEESVKSNGVSIYPNPASDIVNIVTEEQARVNVFTITGELVMAEMVSNNTLNIEGLNAGVYIVEVITENTRATERLMVTK